MNQYLQILLSGVIACIAAGCNTLSSQPSLRHTAGVPLTLSPGAAAIIAVRAEDRYGMVQRLVGTIEGDDGGNHITLFDDGVFEEEGMRADEKAGDGLWSTRVPVPLNTPEGEAVVLFTAYRGDGIPVEVRGADGAVVPLQLTLPVHIRYPAP